MQTRQDRARQGRQETPGVMSRPDKIKLKRHGHGLVPRPGHSSRNPSTPKKKFPGEVRGYQEPSRARQTGQYRTGQPSRDKQTGTGQPTGTGSPPGQSSEAEASSGHDMTSGALTGSLSNRFHVHDKGAGS